MRPPEPLPRVLGVAFSVAQARAHGVGKKRLFFEDLRRPFHGVRLVVGAERETPRQPDAMLNGESTTDRYSVALRREELLIRALACRLRPGQFFSHRSAALLWGMPLPYQPTPELHLGVIRPQRAPRLAGTFGHSLLPHRCGTVSCKGIPVTDPATTWASLGNLPIPDLVAAGDFLARKYRPGHGRPSPRRMPLVTIEELRAKAALGRWNGNSRLRSAVELIREDAWSPRESLTRLQLLLAGLPEPGLNIDVYATNGAFLGCVDMVYPQYKIGVEYQGELHRGSYAKDIERVERLRAEGWIIIQVSRVLLARPSELTKRVGEALRSRGWQG